MRAQQIRLDLDGFVERLRGRELVDAGKERLGILVERLLDVAADLGDFADRTRHSGLDDFGGLLRTRVELGSTSLGSFTLLLDEIPATLGVCTATLSRPPPRASANVSCDSALPTPFPRTPSETTIRISPTWGDQECWSLTSVPHPTTALSLSASRLTISPRSISLTQADSTFGWLMLRGRNNRSCVGKALAKSSTAASSARVIRWNSISPASVFTRRG